jgi:hypothetical protein
MSQIDYSQISNDYGFIVTLPGFSHDTATPEQCVVHSKYPSPKIKMNATPLHYGIVNAAISVDRGVGTFNVLTVPHKLAFTPTALVQYYDPAISSNRQYGIMPYFFTAFDRFRAYTDNTNFKIDMVNTINNSTIVGRTITFRYYIFAENGS